MNSELYHSGIRYTHFEATSQNNQSRNNNVRQSEKSASLQQQAYLLNQVYRQKGCNASLVLGAMPCLHREVNTFLELQNDLLIESNYCIFKRQLFRFAFPCKLGSCTNKLRFTNQQTQTCVLKIFTRMSLFTIFH